ncbi:MAG: hypothetical protein U0802_19610 [Candidatus Binatia bacterium]
MSATMFNVFAAQVFDRLGDYRPAWQAYTALETLALAPALWLWRAPGSVATPVDTSAAPAAHRIQHDPQTTPRRAILFALVLALTASTSDARAECPDCDGDGRVTIDELVTGITIALGGARLDACPTFDRDGDGQVSIDEILAGVAAALRGCEAAHADADPIADARRHDPADRRGGPAGVAARWIVPRLATSAPHPSAGPHGGRVRTFLNPALFASLDAGNGQHPAGAATVKELYLSGENVRGWAVAVKLRADSDQGRGWYWFEDFGSGSPFEGVGLAACTGCHSAGRDFIRIPFPLQ